MEGQIKPIRHLMTEENGLKLHTTSKPVINNIRQLDSTKNIQNTVMKDRLAKQKRITASSGTIDVCHFATHYKHNLHIKQFYSNNCKMTEANLPKCHMFLNSARSNYKLGIQPEILT